MSGINMEELKEKYHMAVTALESRFFSDDICRNVLKEHFKVLSLEGLGLADKETGVNACGCLQQDLKETRRSRDARLRSNNLTLIIIPGRRSGNI